MLTIHAARHWKPELAYVCQVLFGEMLGMAWQMELQDDDLPHRIILPNGNTLTIENHFQQAFSAPSEITGFIPHPFAPAETVVCLFGNPHFTLDPSTISCGPDLLAATFFMLSRVEENAPGQLDRHGRFPAAQSLAFRARFLQRPVVNEWADLLWQMFQRLGWQGARPKRQFRLSFSCDVDHPRLWWNGMDRLRTLGGAIFKRGDLREALFFARNKWQHDPYDVFDEWFDLLEQRGITAQFNFLGERPRESDCWYPLRHPFVGQLMDKIARRGHRIGFHPSYEAFENEAIFQQELDSLQAVSPLPVSSGRQHYLRFKSPETWQMWENAGLRTDSTLGYPDAEGFRCGICHDFPVFDSKTRTVLQLREEPLIAMDVTLAQYRGYKPGQAAEKLRHLRRAVEKHGGTYTLLWHNSSWNTPFWTPWQRVLLDFLAETTVQSPVK